jgi:DNA-binding MarR family transcriptional regulator
VDGISDSAVAAARDIRVVFSRLRRRLKDIAVDGLTPSQTAVLTRLWKDGPSSASALAGAEQIRPQSMATILSALGVRGLIKRTQDPNDGRRQMVSLTPAGKKRAESDRRAREEWLARTLQERYTESERRVIVDALSLLERLTEQ